MDPRRNGDDEGAVNAPAHIADDEDQLREDWILSDDGSDDDASTEEDEDSSDDASSDEEHEEDEEDGEHSTDYNDEDTTTFDVENEFLFFDNGGCFFDELDSGGNESDDEDVPRFYTCALPNTRWSITQPEGEDPHIVSTEENNHVQVLDLEAAIWKFLPEEVLFMILMWLPPAAQSRFRCVCTKWKTVLSSRAAFLNHNSKAGRPSCTVKSNARAKHVSAYCHTERKWFDLPCSPVKSLLVNPADLMTAATTVTEEENAIHLCDSPFTLVFNWKLADVDGELFCYQSKKRGCLWIAVCNPMILDSCLLLPPVIFDIVSLELIELIKLLVDRETKTFKVIVKMSSGTAIFDSVSFDWAIFQSIPDTMSPYAARFIASKGGVYALSEDLVFHLDLTSRTWNTVNVELPCEEHRKYAIVSSGSEVLLIQIVLRKKESISMWKLVTDGVSDDVPLFSATCWEKQSIALPQAVRALAINFRGCTLHGSEYICFNGGKTNQWIRYDFKRRTWCLMPSRGKRVAELNWFDWEPGFDMDLR